jgi:pectate lyase
VTVGGDCPDCTVYRVTNLDDQGEGSLRDAVSADNRTVVFDVAGDIAVSDQFIDITGAFITIDGFTAPSPGITLVGGGLRINAMRGGKNDVIIRGIKIRDAAASDSTSDGISFSHGVFNIVVDHVSISNSGDENISCAFEAHEITVSNSIFTNTFNTGKQVLFTDDCFHVTIHHNAMVGGRQRIPRIKANDDAEVRTDVNADVVNNVVYDWCLSSGCGFGTQFELAAQGNVVNNFYFSPMGMERALEIEAGENVSAYVSGNVPDSLNAVGTSPEPLPAPAVTTQDACSAAAAIVAEAGAPFRDDVDTAVLAQVDLTLCE